MNDMASECPMDVLWRRLSAEERESYLARAKGLVAGFPSEEVIERIAKGLAYGERT